MYTEICFFEKDLLAYRCESNGDLSDNPEINKRYFNTHFKYNDNTYKLFWLISGECKIICNDGEKEVKQNSFAFSRPHDQFRFYPDTNRPFNLMYFTIHPSVFYNRGSDENYFRVFEGLIGTAAITSLSQKKYHRLSNMLHSARDVVDLHFSRVYIEPMVMAIITEMCILYDASHPTETVVSNNISVRIMRYIEHHYTDKISYEVLQNRYFVSAMTINTIVKRYTGKTFWNYVTSLRLKEAILMINTKAQSIAKAAELSGFSSYSTFYRAFTKRYGYPPKEQKVHQENHWPLSKE